MKRCLQIVAALHIGGAEKVARDIGLYFRQKGYEVDYLLFGDTVKGYDREVVEHGCRIIHFEPPSSGYFTFFRKLKRLMRENHYDVVHAHTMFNAGWAMMAAKQEGVPVRIAHAHSALDNGKNRKKQLYEKIMRHLILKNATHLIACGDAAGERLFGRRAYQERGLRILNGIDVERFAFNRGIRNVVRKDLDLEASFVIGHVGRLSAEKNQAFLIRLLPQIAEKKNNAKLLLLGDGNDRDKLQKLVHDSDLEDRVIMTGNVGNVQDYLCAMDVFAFPSLYEGMPLSIVEVQANGLPCILSTSVPKDVYLTDLIRSLPLDREQDWVEAICSAERPAQPEPYALQLTEQGFRTESSMEKISMIYDRIK